jgi:peptidoglycan/LPS O-acetylase OafA/YrhL
LIDIGRSNNFDLLRLFAALEVVYMHTVHHLELWPGPPWLFHALQSLPGVPIFFIVSGFLVTDSYLRSSTASGYAVKRALRIYPGLIVNIAIMELIVAATGGFDPLLDAINYTGFFMAYAATAAMGWAGYFFDAPYISAGAFQHYPSGVLWTLTVELTFYLTLPLFLETWRRDRNVGVFYIAIASVLSLFLSLRFYGSPHTFVTFSVGPYFWIFVLGIVARLYWSTVRRVVEGCALPWLAAHFLLLAISMWLGESGHIYFENPTTITVLRAIVLAGTTLSIAFTHPRPALLRGYDVSYGVYLYHMLVIYTMIYFEWTGRMRFWPVVLAATIALGFLSFVLIERPAIRLRRRVRMTVSDRAEMIPAK